MKTSRVLATVVGAAAVISLAASCGDNSAVCGEGTVEVDGICVPDDLVDCGPGTVDMGGECVPDGSVICEQGTVFDEESGTCVVDPSACAEGTVLIDGQCVPEDESLTADHEEVAEPNDGILATDDIAGQFALPAAGDSVTIHGCINPYRDLDDNGNPDPDLDLWIVTTTGPALVDVTADGVGGLAAGYQVISAVDEPVIDDNFVRFGINLTGDTSSRQMYLPAAGVYGIFMADSRSLFLQDGAAGSPEACYYTTITNVAIPAATPVTLNTEIAGTHDGDVDFYSADAANCSFFIGVHDMQAAAAFSSVWALKNDEVFEYGEPDGAGTPGVVRTGALTDADTVLYVIDPIYNYALNPVDYTLEVVAPPAGPIPTGGGNITITNVDAGEDFVGCFDIAAGTMDHFDITVDDDMRMVFIDEHGALITDRGTRSSLASWTKFPAAGRYHVVLIETEAAADVPSIMMSSEIISEPIQVLTVGTLVDDAPFNDVGNTWYSFDPAGEAWLGFTVPAATSWGSELSLDFYDLGGVGTPGSDFPNLFFMDITPDGSDTVGRVTYGDTRDYLVRVTDFDGIADSTSTYDLDVQPRVFTDLGTVSEAAPVAETGFDLAVAAERLFFVRASRGGTHTVTVTPTGFDAVVEFLGVTENILTTADSAGDGGAETRARSLTTFGWIAFRVSNYDGTDTGVFDISITSDTAYEVVPGDLVFADVCGLPGGMQVTGGDDAITGALAAPAGFTLFGEAAATFWASTNGFVSFGAPTGSAFLSNATSLPSSSNPNGLIAPYWDDLYDMTVCYRSSAGIVTVQWTGELYSSPYTLVEFQTRLHGDGTIELIYGPNHLSTGSGATVGLENLAGDVGQNMGINTSGSSTPNTSFVATPAP